MTKQYKTDLSELKRQYHADMNALRKEVEADPGLNTQGKQTYLAQRAEPLNAKYSGLLETLVARMQRDVGIAASDAAKAIKTAPAATADTRQEWDRVSMLLDAGSTLGEIVRGAAPERLRAIQEWGPTYIEAQAIKSRPAGLEGLNHDTSAGRAPLLAQVTKRWAEILPNGHQITAGAEAAGIAAGVAVSAKAFGDVLNGVANTGSDLAHAMTAHYAEQGATEGFSGLSGE